MLYGGEGGDFGFELFVVVFFSVDALHGDCSAVVEDTLEDKCSSRISLSLPLSHARADGRQTTLPLSRPPSLPPSLSLPPSSVVCFFFRVLPSFFVPSSVGFSPCLLDQFATRVHHLLVFETNYRFREYGERNSPTACLPAMMWRLTWIPRPRGRPRQHTQHPLGLM